MLCFVFYHYSPVSRAAFSTITYLTTNPHHFTSPCIVFAALTGKFCAGKAGYLATCDLHQEGNARRELYRIFAALRQGRRLGDAATSSLAPFAALSRFKNADGAVSAEAVASTAYRRPLPAK